MSQVEVADPGPKVRSLYEATSTPLSEYTYWKGEITAAEKDIERWHIRAEKINRIYADERDAIETGDRKFNLFASNVDILQSAVYANPPKIEVSRRFKDMDDDVSRVAAMILERTLESDLDEVDHNFDEIIKDAIFDRLVPGAGVVWLRVEGDEGDEREVVAERVHWKDFLWSPCRTWAERRWIAKKVYMTKDEGIKRFGKLFESIPLDYKSEKPKVNDTTEPHKGTVMKACIYEIWDRRKREVIWLSKEFARILDKRADFLKLENFEPCPKPLFATMTTSKVEPLPDYTKCQDQYEELNIINNRLTLLYQACKVTGVYNKSVDGIKRMLNEGFDNTLIPVDNWAMFAEQGGLKGQIDWLPLEAIVVAIGQLQLAAESKKQHIYELTGISDIVRGATKATETAAAQKLKANFASAKQQSLQKDVERFVTDIFKIKAEILTRHFDPQYFIQVSNIQNTPDAQFALPAIQLLKNSILSEHRISIKPESMAQVDYASEKADRMELLTTVGTYLEKAMPLGAANPMAAQLIVSMLKFGVAGFRAGKEFEGILDKQLLILEQQQRQMMANPPPQKPSPEEIDAQIKMKEIDSKFQIEQAKLNMEQQSRVQDMQKAEIEAQKAREELLIKNKELEIKQAELDLKKAELNIKLVTADNEISAKNKELELRESEISTNKQLKEQELTQKSNEFATKSAMDKEIADKTMEWDKQKYTAEFNREQSKVDTEAQNDQTLVAKLHEVSESIKQANDETNQLLETLLKDVNKPRKKRFIHDEKTGRPVGVEDYD